MKMKRALISAWVVVALAFACVALAGDIVVWDGTNFTASSGGITSSLPILKGAGLTTNQLVIVTGATTNWLSFTNGILYDILEVAP